MKDKLITSPLTGNEDACYKLPINEKNYAYKCLNTGFETNDFMIEDKFDFEKLEETLPELYKDIKIVDPKKRVWYPQVINIKEKGIVFVNGTSDKDWCWAAIKSIKVKEDEKERFKNTKTGEYMEYKNDPSSMKKFDRFDFIYALEYIGALDD